MTICEKLKQNLPTFKHLTGFTIVEFDELLQQLTPFWLKMEEERLARPNRQRAIGGGRTHALVLEDRLLMTLLWLHLHLNTEALGLCFGVNKSTVSRNTNRILPLLRQLKDERWNWPDPPKRGQGKTIEQALRAYPELATIIEATARPG